MRRSCFDCYGIGLLGRGTYVCVRCNGTGTIVVDPGPTPELDLPLPTDGLYHRDPAVMEMEEREEWQ